MTESKEWKLEKIHLLEKKLALSEGLPHLYGLPMYKWAREFFESRNKLNLICAANQIGKSTIQIRKCIQWATALNLWPELWQTRPVQFWYLYPSKDVTTIEFETKWVPLLPAGNFKEHAIYGWRAEYRDNQVYALFFNSGVRVYFKTYAQNKKTLQTGSVHAIFADEELPAELFDELMFRLAATGGYFHMVFTATLGQKLWWDAIEEKGDKEKFPEAFKRQISMYDCTHYEDGTEAPWSLERIAEIINLAKSEAEVQRRVFGRFVTDEGLKYPTYVPQTHFIPYHPVPDSWKVYTGIDYGGGGEGHPAAIVHIAVDPTYQKGRVFMSWRGDNLTTTASDIINKYIAMRGMRDWMPPRYDFAAKDLHTIASRMGLSFLHAEKSHEIGEMTLNTLFRNNMLMVYDTPDNQKLSNELISLRHSTNKRKARDNLCDALRYAVASIPWDWSIVGANDVPVDLRKVETDDDVRRKAFFPESEEGITVEEEFDGWNEMYGTE